MKKSTEIKDYGYIGDCHSAALVSKNGSIDWCVVPRIDCPSCFGRLLDWENGGYFQICPTAAYQVKRQYIKDTMMLETTFITDKGEVKLIDFFTMREDGLRHPHAQLLRVIEGVRGAVELQITVLPRLEYNSIKPWIRKYKITGCMALGGEHGLLFSGSKSLELKDQFTLHKKIIVKAKEREYFSMLYRKPEDLDYQFIEVPSIDELDCRYYETLAWWQSWVQKGKFAGIDNELVKRSALVLKCLSNAPTGAIAAAATTSLPESIGGERNWDYRFSWIRDSYLSVKTLARLGFGKEADRFRRFIERSSQGRPDGLQTMFGVTGQRRIPELILPDLPGYKNSQPVRIGNKAVDQLQLDMYGYLIDLAWNWHLLGSSPDEDYWYFLENIINVVIKCWVEPDCGIWEIRETPRHFVYSKMMCWVALDRGIKLAEDLKCNVSIAKWREKADEIKKTIYLKGYHEKLGSFVQAFDNDIMDASLLCLPMYGFIDYNDERMLRTTQMVKRELERNGLLLRYPPKTDGFESYEGTFIPCTFWLAICLFNQGKHAEAKEVFDNAVSACNDLGLFSEECDPYQREMLGNFPQAFTHLSFIEAALLFED